MPEFAPEQIAAPETTVPAIVEKWARGTPGAWAFLAPGRRPLCYARLSELIVYTVASLRSLGIQAGDRVAVTLPDGPEMAAVFLGVASGAVFAPLNPTLTAAEFEYCLRDLPARAVITSEEDSVSARVAAKLGIPTLSLVPDPAAEAGMFTLPAASPSRNDLEHPTPEADALVMYTSGTTARPKLVPLTHRNLCAAARNIVRTVSLNPQDRSLNVMPLFHIHALMSGVLAPLAAGGSTVLTAGFHAPQFLDWVRDFRPTWYSAAPPIHQSILSRAKAAAEKLTGHSLRVIRSAAAPLPPALMKEMETAWRVPVIEFIGMTEAGQQIASNPLPPRRRKPGSVGLPAGTEIIILSEEGQPLPAGQAGELAIRGESVTRGYERNPEANNEAFHRGWLRTGDEGYFDSDGYLFITGRRKEMINRGGEKVSPREVEELLLELPSVEQAVVFAVPHRQLGEAVGAAVVIRPGAQVDEAQIRTFAATQLAAFKVPRVVRIVADLPRGPTRKPRRIGLAEALGIPAIDDARAAGTPVHVPPRNDLEHQLAEIWCEILMIQSAGIHDSFLAAGGDSLMAARFLFCVRERLGFEVGLAAFFGNPTIAAVAEAMTGTPRPAADPVQTL